MSSKARTVGFSWARRSTKVDHARERLLAGGVVGRGLCGHEGQQVAVQPLQLFGTASTPAAG